MTTVRVVAFLGTSDDKRECHYELAWRDPDGRESAFSTTVQSILHHEIWWHLARHVSGPDIDMALIVVGTQRTRDDWITVSDLRKEVMNSLGDDFHRVSIGFLNYDVDAIGAHGARSEEAFWHLFGDLEALLGGKAVALDG